MSQKQLIDHSLSVSPATVCDTSMAAVVISPRIDAVTTLALEGIRQQADLKGVPMKQLLSDLLKDTMKNLGVRLL